MRLQTVNQNDYEVNVSKIAADLLFAQVMYLAQFGQSGNEAADKLVNKFEKAVKSLEFMPQKFQYLEGFHVPKNKYRYMVFHKNYLLIYEIIEDKKMVEIMFVINSKQNYCQRLFNQYPKT